MICNVGAAGKRKTTLCQCAFALLAVWAMQSSTVRKNLHASTERSNGGTEQSIFPRHTSRIEKSWKTVRELYIELRNNRGFRGSHLAFAEIDIKDETTRIMFLLCLTASGQRTICFNWFKRPCLTKVLSLCSSKPELNKHNVEQLFFWMFLAGFGTVLKARSAWRGGRGLLFFGFPVSSTSRLQSEQILQKLTCAAHQVIIPQTSRHQHSKGKHSRHEGKYKKRKKHVLQRHTSCHLSILPVEMERNPPPTNPDRFGPHRFTPSAVSQVGPTPT